MARSPAGLPILVFLQVDAQNQLWGQHEGIIFAAFLYTENCEVAAGIFIYIVEGEKGF